MAIYLRVGIALSEVDLHSSCFPLLCFSLRFAGWVWTFRETLTPKSEVGGRSHPQQPDLEGLCCSCCSPALPETSFPWELLRLVQIPDESLLLKTKKMLTSFL